MQNIVFYSSKIIKPACFGESGEMEFYVTLSACSKIQLQEGRERGRKEERKGQVMEQQIPEMDKPRLTQNKTASFKP